MTLPTSGPISLAGVQAELGTGGAIDMNRDDVRDLAGVSAGAIAMSNFYGKQGPGSQAPISAIGVGDEARGQASGIGTFTATAHPSVTVNGGTAPISFRWTITTQDGTTFTLLDATLQTCRVEHVIGRYGYIGQCTLACEVADAKGQRVTVTGVVASFNYQNEISNQNPN